MSNTSLLDISLLNSTLILKEYENILSENKSKDAALECIDKSIYSYFQGGLNSSTILTMVELLFKDGIISLTDIFNILKKYNKPYYDSKIFTTIIREILVTNSNNSSLTEEYYIKICEFFNDNIIGMKFIQNIGYIEIKQCSKIFQDEFITLYSMMDCVDNSDRDSGDSDSDIETRFEYYKSFNTSIIFLLMLEKRFDDIQHICDSYYILNKHSTLLSKLDRNMIISLVENVDISSEVKYLINFCNEHYTNDVDLILIILSKYWFRSVFDMLNQSLQDSLKKSKEFKKLILKKGNLSE